MGDLSENLTHSTYKDEFSLIQNLFIDTIKNIKNILKSIINTSKQVTTTFKDVEQRKIQITTDITNITSLTFNILESNEKIFSNTNKVKDEFFAFNSSLNKM